MEFYIYTWQKKLGIFLFLSEMYNRYYSNLLYYGVLWCNNKVYSITINFVELKSVHFLVQKKKKKHAQYNSRVE